MSFNSATYKHFSLKFIEFSQVLYKGTISRTYRVLVEDLESNNNPLVCICTIKPEEGGLLVEDADFESVSPLTAKALELAIKCFLHGLCKFCRVHNIPKLKIKHKSTTVSDAFKEIGVFSNEILYSGTEFNYSVEIKC